MLSSWHSPFKITNVTCSCSYLSVRTIGSILLRCPIRYPYIHGHDERNDHEKSDSNRNPARNRSSHPFCSHHHPYIFFRSTCHVSFSLVLSGLHVLSLLALSSSVPFAPSPSAPSPSVLSPLPCVTGLHILRSSSSRLARLFSSFLASSTSFPQSAGMSHCSVPWPGRWQLKHLCDLHAAARWSSALHFLQGLGCDRYQKWQNSPATKA